MTLAVIILIASIITFISILICFGAIVMFRSAARHVEKLKEIADGIVENYERAEK